MNQSLGEMGAGATALALEFGRGSGAQAREGRLRGVVVQAGFTRIRRTAETPCYLILEARM